jgi:hypothetical protein
MRFYEAIQKQGHEDEYGLTLGRNFMIAAVMDSNNVIFIRLEVVGQRVTYARSPALKLWENPSFVDGKLQPGEGLRRLAGLMASPPEGLGWDLRGVESFVHLPFSKLFDVKDTIHRDLRAHARVFRAVTKDREDVAIKYLSRNQEHEVKVLRYLNEKGIPHIPKLVQANTGEKWFAMAPACDGSLANLVCSLTSWKIDFMLTVSTREDRTCEPTMES